MLVLRKKKQTSDSRDGQSGPGPGTKFFFDRDRDRNFFFTGTGTGTKNDWSRSCLSDSVVFPEMYTLHDWSLTPRLHVNISCSQFQTSLSRKQNRLTHSSSAKPSYFFKHALICFRRTRG
jgi:hypothetical protein